MRAYYIDLGQKDVLTGSYERFVFDADGIPQYPYPSGLQYNVTFVCHHALYHATLYQRFGRKEDLHALMNAADWIRRNGADTAAGFVIPYSFEVPGLQTPWISALGQGRMLSVLTRAYEASGNVAYLDLAKRAAGPFEKDVEDGGVRRSFPDGGHGFEEYPLPKRNLVLNGLITSLFGVYDLAETTREERFFKLFTEAIDSLERNLGHYDLGYWSAYDLSGPIRRVASDGYHQYHVMQLWALYEMTGREAFKTMSRRWLALRKGPRLHALRSLSRAKTVLLGPH